MSSLTLRIFAWFWLTMTIVAAVFISLGFLLENDAARFAQFDAAMENLAASNGQLVFRAYQIGGAAEAARERARLLGALKFSTFLLDAEDRDVLEPAADDAVREVVRRARQDGRAHRPRGNGPPLAAARIATDSDGSFAFAVRMDDFGPNDFSQRPLAWIGRIAAAVAVSGLICYGLARYLSAPVRALRSAAQRLAQGELSTRVMQPRHGRDEVAALQRDFNRMAERIERLVESQQRLLRDISHELRSPLARLVVALELARRNSEESLATPLNRIELEAARMDELIGRTLTAARAEVDDIESFETIDASEITRRAAGDSSFEGAAQGKSVQCRTTGRSLVRGSPALLHSALDNVIRNALRFSPAGRIVDVEVVGPPDADGAAASDGETLVTIRVRDHGPGVPAEALPLLFRPFYRVESARDRETGGVGLGLTIAERAVRLHGGQIRAENHPAGGLLVTIELPALTSEI